MACYDESNNVLYADDDVVSDRYYGVPSVLVKTVTVDLGLSVPTNLCISFVCQVTGIIAYASGYAQFTIVVNGDTILTYNTKVCGYTTLSESCELVDGDVVDVYYGGYDSLGYPVSVSITRYDASARNFRISEVRVPPVSDAGGPYVNVVDNNVSFNGSGSTDVDGTIVLYEWDFGDGETDTGMIVTHYYTVENIYTVELTVTDDDGLTDTDTTTATIGADVIKVGDNVLLIPNYCDVYDQVCIKGKTVHMGDTVKLYPIKGESKAAIKERWSLNDKITIRGSNT